MTTPELENTMASLPLFYFRGRPAVMDVAQSGRSGGGGVMAHAYFTGGGTYSRYDTAADRVDVGIRSRFRETSPASRTAPTGGQYMNDFNWPSFLVSPSEQAGREAIRRVLTEGGYPAKTGEVKQWPAARGRLAAVIEGRGRSG